MQYSQEIVGTLSLLITAYGVYLQHKLHRATTNTHASAEKVWWRSPLLAAMVILLCLSWGPWLVDRWYLRDSPPRLVVNEWGIHSLPNKQLKIRVTGLEERADERLMAVAFHNFGDVDFADVSKLQKSSSYDFRSGGQLLLIKLDDEFIEAYSKGARNTAYVLLLTPPRIDKQSFSTLRQAYAMGAKQIWAGGGPP